MENNHESLNEAMFNHLTDEQAAHQRKVLQNVLKNAFESGNIYAVEGFIENSEYLTHSRELNAHGTSEKLGVKKSNKRVVKTSIDTVLGNDLEEFEGVSYEETLRSLREQVALRHEARRAESKSSSVIEEHKKSGADLTLRAPPAHSPLVRNFRNQSNLSSRNSSPITPHNAREASPVVKSSGGGRK